MNFAHCAISVFLSMNTVFFLDHCIMCIIFRIFLSKEHKKIHPFTQHNDGENLTMAYICAVARKWVIYRRNRTLQSQASGTECADTSCMADYTRSNTILGILFDILPSKKIYKAMYWRRNYENKKLRQSGRHWLHTPFSADVANSYQLLTSECWWQ